MGNVDVQLHVLLMYRRCITTLRGTKSKEVNSELVSDMLYHKLWCILVCRLVGPTAGGRGKKKSEEYRNLCCQA